MAVRTKLGRDEDGGNESAVALISLQREAGETAGVEDIATICDPQEECNSNIKCSNIS